MGNRRLSINRFEKLFESLSRELQLNQSTLVGQKVRVKSVGNTTTTLTADDSGCVCLFDNSAASTVILPAPQAGLEFTFITTVTAAADHVIRTSTLNTDGFLGGVSISSTTASKAAAFAADADGSNDFITLGHSSNSTGGAAGSRVHVTCIDGENWAVDGQLAGVGSTMATPFGDAQQ
tara:strand:+ start:1964 stop:2497 length:534 start_codon:yes stop_codon:yes gene_type:complete